MPQSLEANDFTPLWDALLCCHRLKSGLPASICARTGAVLGTASPAQEAALGDYFLALGLAFQILDDVINLQVSHLRDPEIGLATNTMNQRHTAMGLAFIASDARHTHTLSLVDAPSLVHHPHPPFR